MKTEFDRENNYLCRVTDVLGGANRKIKEPGIGILCMYTTHVHNFQDMDGIWFKEFN